MRHHHSGNKPQQNRREFLGNSAKIGAGAALSATLGASLRTDANERADAWFESKMAERSYVSSPHGGFIINGTTGYYSGGPGVSAHTIYDKLRGAGRKVDPLDFSFKSHPHDAGDFGRCMELLDAVPEWRERIGEMADVSAQWSRLSSMWPKIERSYRAGRRKEVDRMIRSAIAA